MPAASLTPQQLQEAVDLMETHGSASAAARAVGIPRATFQSRLTRAQGEGYKPYSEPFEVEDLPDEIASVEEIIGKRLREFERRQLSEEARRLIRVDVKIKGPIGIVHFGDPHVDSPGCDLASLFRYCDLIRNTEGLFGANVGDNQDNWIGRLSHLRGEQTLTAAESWRLVEEFIRRVQWLYLIGGNHDAWSGTGDPLKWITRTQQGVFEQWRARLNLVFPNGKEVRVSVAHDWPGNSQFNTAHGAAKAVMHGWRDHIVACGHKHISGYNILKCPATGLISHAIRVAGFKVYDSYAKQLNLPNQNISPACVTIIQPDRADDDPGLVTVLHDVETAIEFLKMLRLKA